MKTMRDYYDLYLKCNVLLLADVFETFRNNSHYLTAPGLSWDAMLKMTKLSLNLLQILACTYSFKKAQEVELLIFLIDTGKPTITY